ncbi:hypothetical protein [Streptomyces sp. F-3]|uniref:hypothetical protein n=1 Tax=Streptomyces sp. F-3 TaxID=1840095 RepID=UPI003FA69463
MGDTGTRKSRTFRCPPHVPDRIRQESTVMPRIALFTLTVCLLAVAAAVVSFVEGSWLGIVWVLLAGLSSNMTWYYVRRERMRQNRSVSG